VLSFTGVKAGQGVRIFHYYNAHFYRRVCLLTCSRGSTPAFFALSRPKVIGEATMLFLQVLFLMWRLDDQVGGRHLVLFFVVPLPGPLAPLRFLLLLSLASPA